MHYFDDSLLPENQQKLVIQVAPYGPQWAPGDSDDIPVSIDAQVQVGDFPVRVVLNQFVQPQLPTENSHH